MDARSQTRSQPDPIDRALTGVDRAVSRRIAQLVTDDREESLRVLRGLIRLGPMAVDFLADACTRNPKDARLRCRIISALMAFGSVPAARPAAVQAVLSARLQERDPAVVMRIQLALGSWHRRPRSGPRIWCGASGDDPGGPGIVGRGVGDGRAGRVGVMRRIRRHPRWPGKPAKSTPEAPEALRRGFGAPGGAFFRSQPGASPRVLQGLWRESGWVAGGRVEDSRVSKRVWPETGRGSLRVPRTTRREPSPAGTRRGHRWSSAGGVSVPTSEQNVLPEPNSTDGRSR